MSILGLLELPPLLIPEMALVQGIEILVIIGEAVGSRVFVPGSFLHIVMARVQTILDRLLLDALIKFKVGVKSS